MDGLRKTANPQSVLSVCQPKFKQGNSKTKIRGVTAFSAALSNTVVNIRAAGRDSSVDQTLLVV